MTKRSRALVLLVAGACVLAGLAAPAHAATARPAHDLICTYTPDIPSQFGSDAPISAEGFIHCSPAPPPDVSSTTIIIWRHDFSRNKFYVLAENTSNKSALSWAIKVTGTCAARNRWGFHTELINDAFHGNWDHTDVNSTEVILFC